ncbi:hypothetical protein EV06_1189 [Prochlorococcus sp. MIT 0602]|nr:hypothetical protein EV06_1189 [Prochlorococcus sp. MIT 0602]
MRNTKDIVIPIFSDLLCSSILFKVLVKEARATALSADKINSKRINTGNNGANSLQWSIPSSIGEKKLSDAESIIN